MGPATGLSDVLLAFVTLRRPDMTASPSPALERALASALADARKAWPDVPVDESDFLERLAHHLPDGPPTAETIVAMHTAELYLACACARHEPHALSLFDARFMPEVGAFVAQIDASHAFADEVRQQLREKLFVGAGDVAPKILDYSARGPLGGWLRVAAVRVALNLRRGKDALTSGASATETVEFVSPGADPELDYLKTRYGAELRDALRTTLAALPQDERTVMRMHYVDRLNIEEIGVAYHVHRATVARWIAASR